MKQQPFEILPFRMKKRDGVVVCLDVAGADDNFSPGLDCSLEDELLE